MRRPSSAMLVALIALFLALGGAGMAATGGNFILGKTNSATSTTSLSAPIGGKALQVSNTSTAAGATPLGLTAAPGHAPFTVNTTVKIPNLNADKLDGIDSSGFVQGTGKSSSDILTPLGDGVKRTLVSLPGLGALTALCGGAPPYGQIELDNPGPSPTYVTVTSFAAKFGADYWETGFVLPAKTTDYLGVGADTTNGNPAVSTLWQFSPGNHSGERVATVNTSLMFDGNYCVFRASVLQQNAD